MQRPSAGAKRHRPPDTDRKRQKIGVDKDNESCYNTQALRSATQYRGVEQLEARRAHNPEVVGSSPASATITSVLIGFDIL